MHLYSSRVARGLGGYSCSTGAADKRVALSVTCCGDRPVSTNNVTPGTL